MTNPAMLTKTTVIIFFISKNPQKNQYRNLQFQKRNNEYLMISVIQNKNQNQKAIL